MMDIVQLIDRAVEKRAHAEPQRNYLGGSVIGRRCKREVWYMFRWAYRVMHKGRMHRLWERGHLEEFRFVGYMREAGYEIRDYTERLLWDMQQDRYYTIPWEEPPGFDLSTGAVLDVHQEWAHIARAGQRPHEAPKQWGGLLFDGHYGYHCDGRVRGPKLPEGWGLLECKTHNEKSFKLLSEKGVATSKPEHYVQMQVYMHHEGLPWALYIAVNKNTDELYTEIVHYKPEIGEFYHDLAPQLIYAKSAPQRVSEDPSWWTCKMCDFREICHRDHGPQKNCRSCTFAEPVPRDGVWQCNNYGMDIPETFIPTGCDKWDPIR